MTNKFDLRAINLRGGRVCLDFVNTIHDRVNEPEFDYLGGYSDLIEWCMLAGAIEETTGRDLHKLARANRERSADVFDRATELREALFRLFEAAAHHRKVDAQDLAILNSQVADAWQHLRLTQTGESFGHRWAEQNETLEGILWEITKSAQELLTSDDLARVKECPSCKWLFIDGSKNQSRRWCSMETCGNREKAKQYYQRTKKND